MVNINRNFSDGDHIPDELKAQIRAILAQTANKLPSDALKIVEKAVQERKQRPNPETGGFTLEALHRLLQNPLGTPECPIKLSSVLQLSDLSQAPGFQHCRSFLLKLADVGKVKATASGNLPRTFVLPFVDEFVSEKEKELFLSFNKVINEDTLFSLHTARILCGIAGFSGKFKGHFVVRKKALPLLDDEAAGNLFQQLFLSLITKFNIAYGNPVPTAFEWIQHAIPYALKPLQDQATDWLPIESLPQVVLDPMSREKIGPLIEDNGFYTAPDMVERMIISPLAGWGLLDRKYDGTDSAFRKVLAIRKSPIFDSFIRFE